MKPSGVSKVPFRLRKLAFALSEPRLDKRSVAGRPKFVSPIFPVVMRLRACWCAELEVRMMCLGVRRFLSCVSFACKHVMNFTLLRKPALASIEGVLARPCDKKGDSGFTGRLQAKMSGD